MNICFYSRNGTRERSAKTEQEVFKRKKKQTQEDDVLLLCHFSGVRLFKTPWTVGHQTPQFMGIPRQEYQSELPCLSPGDLPVSEIEPVLLTSPAMARMFFTSSASYGKPLKKITYLIKF